MARVLRKSRLACAVGRCGSCGGGLIRAGVKCECWCHRRGKHLTPPGPDGSHETLTEDGETT